MTFDGAESVAQSLVDYLCFTPQLGGAVVIDVPGLLQIVDPTPVRPRGPQRQKRRVGEGFVEPVTRLVPKTAIVACPRCGATLTITG